MRRILTGLLCVASFAAPASAADLWASPPPPPMAKWHGFMPACDGPTVLWRVTEKFAYQDWHIVGAGTRITGIDGVHEAGVSAGGPGLVDRRYCGATAWLSDGSKADVAFVIEGPHLGTFSATWHVESCVVGHDPFHVYDAQCRSVRP